MVERARPRAAVAGGVRHEHTGVRRAAERLRDGVERARLRRAADRVVQDVHAVCDGVVDRGDAVRVEAAGLEALAARPADLVHRDLGARRHARAGTDLVSVDGDVGAVVPCGRRGGVRAVALSVARRNVVVGRDVLDAEAGEVVPRADELVVARRHRPQLARLADAVPVRRDRDSRLAGERGALRPDAGVDHADDDAGAGLRAAAELRPHAARRVESEEVRRQGRVRVCELVLREAQHGRLLRQLRGLRGREVGCHAVVRDRVVVNLRCADARERVVVLSDEVLLPLLDRRRGGVQLVAGLGRVAGKPLTYPS